MRSAFNKIAEGLQEAVASAAKSAAEAGQTVAGEAKAFFLPASPSIGRIVHYVMANGAVRPAIITAVFNTKMDQDEAHPGMSNLVVFLDGPNDGVSAGMGSHTLWVGSASHNADKTPGTWHLPARS